MAGEKVGSDTAVVGVSWSGALVGATVGRATTAVGAMVGTDSAVGKEAEQPMRNKRITRKNI